VTPWAHVAIDGSEALTTPISKELTAGKHRLRLTNEDLGKTETIVVNVPSGREIVVERNW